MTTTRVLVTGASGYVGGRVVPALLAEGISVRCLARTPAKLSAASWINDVDVVRGSVEDDLSEPMQGVDTAIYLVHSIGEPNWVQRESSQARNFALAAESAGVQRIVFLGGLGSKQEVLSEHLASRQNAGVALASTSVPVIELRAGVIIGSGSASFEMLRYLVDVLPVMVTPKWVNTRCQPVAIANVVSLIVSAVTSAPSISGVLEVGGADIVTYAQMMDVYADAAGLRRRVLLPVPLLTPRLSSHWIGLVTPVPVPLAKELVQSLVNEVVVSERSACDELSVVPMGLAQAIASALDATQQNRTPTTFSDADLVYFHPNELDPSWAGGTVFSDVRVQRTPLTEEQLFSELCSIGGTKGWYRGKLLWQIRGVLDQLAGGPGLRRGRKDQLRIGDALDFWRIEDIQAPHLLRLRAEMRLPGSAWLTWKVERNGAVTTVTQSATFRPRGLLGRLYWAAVLPFHRFIFPAMLSGVIDGAERRNRELSKDRSTPA